MRVPVAVRQAGPVRARVAPAAWLRPLLGVLRPWLPLRILTAMDQLVIWPDPVPCRPENPVQGISRCVALENNSKCPWLNVDYCGIRAEDMADALNDLRLDELTWVVDDDLDPSDVAAAALEVRRAIDERRSDRSAEAVSVRWLANLLERVREHGAGLSSRFAERIHSRDRY